MALDAFAIVTDVYTVSSPCAVVGSTVLNDQSVVPAASASSFAERKLLDE